MAINYEAVYEMLTPDEFEAIYFDAEIKKWIAESSPEWIPELKELWYDWKDNKPTIVKADNVLEAIAKARGVK